MTRQDDPLDEILDLGARPRDPRADSPRTLPPLHLDGPPAEDDEGKQRPPWLGRAAVAIAAVTGVVVGVLGSNARHDAADIAAAESAVHVIAGAPQVDGGPFGVTVSLPLFNAGPRDVEVIWARPEGWRIPPDARPRNVLLPRDFWVSVRSSAVPDCGVSTTDVIELRVRTEAREQTITVEVPAPTDLFEARRIACEANPSMGAYVESVEIVEPLRPDTLTMRLSMKSFDPNLRFTLVGVTASAPGFRMINAVVPVQFERGARASEVDITWEIVGCEATQTLNDVNLGLEFQDEQGRPLTGGTALPGRGVAELARFALEQCPGE